MTHRNSSLFSTSALPAMDTLLVSSVGFSVAGFVLLSELYEYSSASTFEQSGSLGQEFLQFMQGASYRPALVVIFLLFLVILVSRLVGNYVLAKNSIGPFTVRNGRLYKYGDQPNLSFRVETFRYLLGLLDSELCPLVGHEKLAASFELGGHAAGAKFAKAFPHIYQEYRATEGGSHAFVFSSKWEQLDLVGKLNSWAHYDQVSGWGRVVVFEDSPNKIVIDYNHPTLYDDEPGKVFGFFLVGYATEIVAAFSGRSDFAPGNLKMSDDRVRIYFDLS